MNAITPERERTVHQIAGNAEDNRIERYSLVERINEWKRT